MYESPTPRLLLWRGTGNEVGLQKCMYICIIYIRIVSCALIQTMPIPGGGVFDTCPGL